jgi:hypothetical protein
MPYEDLGGFVPKDKNPLNPIAQHSIMGKDIFEKNVYPENSKCPLKLGQCNLK